MREIHPVSIVDGSDPLLKVQQLWSLLRRIGNIVDDSDAALARFSRRSVGIEALELASPDALRLLAAALQARAMQGDLQRAVSCRQRWLAARPGCCLDPEVAAALAEAQRLRRQDAGFEAWSKVWRQLGVALGEPDELPLESSTWPSTKSV